MAYYNPYITGFSTFDLSTRETSCTVDQPLRDNRALRAMPSKKIAEKTKHSIQIVQLPVTTVQTTTVMIGSNASTSRSMLRQRAKGSSSRLSSSLRLMKILPHSIVCLVAIFQSRSPSKTNSLQRITNVLQEMI